MSDIKGRRLGLVGGVLLALLAQSAAHGQQSPPARQSPPPIMGPVSGPLLDGPALQRLQGVLNSTRTGGPVPDLFGPLVRVEPAPLTLDLKDLPPDGLVWVDRSRGQVISVDVPLRFVGMGDVRANRVAAPGQPELTYAERQQACRTPTQLIVAETSRYFESKGLLVTSAQESPTAAYVKTKPVGGSAAVFYVVTAQQLDCSGNQCSYYVESGRWRAERRADGMLGRSKRLEDDPISVSAGKVARAQLTEIICNVGARQTGALGPERS